MKDHMLDNFLRARYYWDRGESAKAFSYLNKVLSGGVPDQVFYWTPSEAKHQAGLPFEIAVANILLTEEVLLHGFDIAFTRLWRAFPLQYLILILAQRQLDRQRDVMIVNLLSQAAASGLLSTDADDYDLSGRVVLDPEAYPEIVDLLGGAAAVRLIEQASVEGAWTRTVATNAELVIDLFLYAVFHREPSIQQDMILGRLDRIADSHGSFLRAFSEHLGRRLADPDSHVPLVSIGMRIDHTLDAARCLREFTEALVSRRFEPFVMRYFSES
jgi:hypothetical protein